MMKGFRMLQTVYTRRIIVASSLFAAICAGYVAGQRGLFSCNAESRISASSSLETLADPTTITPHVTGGGVTAALMPTSPAPVAKDARLNALVEMSEVKTWEILVRPTRGATRILGNLELREAGKDPVTVTSAGVGVSIAKEQQGKTQLLTVSFMPINGTLSTAEKLRTRMSSGGTAVSQEMPNPFCNYTSMGSINSGDELPDRRRGLAEVALSETTFGSYDKLQRKKILYMTFDTVSEK